MAKKRQPKDLIQTGWVTLENGYESTKSLEIIKQILAGLLKERHMIVVLHKDYQSGNCILVDVRDDELLIDKPHNWPGTESLVRVAYKDAAKLWTHFNTRVTSATEDLLYTEFPKQIYQLQRRDHFRVETPHGSQVSFSFKAAQYSNFTLLDISAGGMKLGSNQKILIPTNATVTDISINISCGSREEEEVLLVRKGSVVRSYPDRERRLLCYAVKFHPTGPQEDQLVKFVRQQELDMLRKGLQV